MKTLIAHLACSLFILALLLGCSRGGDFDDANSLFDMGSDRPPTSKTMYAIARVMAANEQDDNAERILRSVLREDPDFRPAWLELAELQVRQQRVEEAIETLKLGIQRVPGDPVLLNNLGICMVLRDDFVRAAEHFRQASETWPRDTRFQANLAMALGMQGREREAREIYQRILTAEDVEHNLEVIRRARMVREWDRPPQPALPSPDDPNHP